MKTDLNDLVFLEQDEAQNILDVKDPGYEVATTRSGYTIIIDSHKNIVATMTSKR